MKMIISLLLFVLTLHTTTAEESEVEKCIDEKRCGEEEYNLECGDDGVLYPTQCEMECAGAKLASKGSCYCKLCAQFNWRVCEPETFNVVENGCEELICADKPFELCG